MQPTKEQIAKVIDLNKVNDATRLQAVLNGVLDYDPSLKKNNLLYFMPIAENQAILCRGYAEECHKFKAHEVAIEFQTEADNWAEMARQAAVELGYEPDIRKRPYWGISHFHGFREVCKAGKWIRYGGEWSIPKHGQSHAFLDQESAQCWADGQYGLLAKWAKEKGLDIPYKVVEMPPKPY